MKKLSLLALTLCCLPAMAQAPQFHVALSGQFGNFTGESELLAVESYQNTPRGYGSPAITYDMKSKTPLQLDLGITSGDDDFTLSYWSGKAKGNGTFNDPNLADQVYYTIPYGEYYGYQIGQTMGGSEVKAHTLDIAWTRTFVKNDKGSLGFSFGLREYKIERNTSLDLWDTSTPLKHEGTDRITATSKGFGLLVGMNARYNFTERVWMTGGLKLAMTDGKNDFDYTETYDPAFSTGNRAPYLEVALAGQKQTSLQTDMDLKLNVNFVAGFDGFVGYQMKSFRDVLGNDAGGAYGYNTIPNFTPRTVGFNGVVVGLAYRF